jgi:hypothetical protein
MSDQLIRATGLWAKTSKVGKPYMAGRWGKLRVLVLERQSADEPSHWLMLGKGSRSRGRSDRLRTKHVVVSRPTGRCASVRSSGAARRATSTCKS